MKLSCTHENLMHTLSYLEWVVGRQSHLPILSNILFEAEHGRLRLLATNLEIGVLAELGAKIEEEGKVALPAKLLVQFIQNLDPQEIISLYQQGNQVVIENGKDKIQLNSVDSRDFPLIPEYSEEYPLSFSGASFSEALKKVAFSVSTNESRVELTGIFISNSERGIHFTATDSFRLAEVTLLGMESSDKMALETFLRDRGGVILPVDALQELARIIQGVDDRVSMAVKENQVFFEIHGVRMVSRVIQGKYPDYQQILPKEFQISIKVSKQEVVRALKMATSFAQYGSGEVKFSFMAENGILEVATISSGVGEQKTIVPLQDSFPEDKELIFQPRHLLEGINTLTGEVVTFHINTKDAPVLLTGENPKEHLYLVMPIKK